MLSSAIRFVATKGPKTASGSVHLFCRVKPGVSQTRHGIASVSDNVVNICVASRAKEGEANKAVRELVSKALGVPKSDVEIVKGNKSREKTVVIANVNLTGTVEEHVEMVRTTLQEHVIP